MLLLFSLCCCKIKLRAFEKGNYDGKSRKPKYSQSSKNKDKVNVNIQDECNLSVINIHYLVKFR